MTTTTKRLLISITVLALIVGATVWFLIEANRVDDLRHENEPMGGITLNEGSIPVPVAMVLGRV